MTHDPSNRPLQMALRTDCRGPLPAPDGYGKNTGRCGDTVELFLLVRDARLQELRYEADGCINTHACASALCTMLRGKSVDEAWQIRPGHLVKYLQSLPENHHHCAELAVGALYRALVELTSHQRRPWMRLYQRPQR